LQISAKEGAGKTRIYYTCMIEIRWFDLVSSPDDLTLFKKRWQIIYSQNHPSSLEKILTWTI